MKDDKKKLAIVGVLAFIVIGVGAFQFMSGGSSAPAKPAPPKKPVTTTSKKDDGPKNPAYANLLPARDPFKAPADSGMPDTTMPKPPTPAPQRHVPRPRGLAGNLGGNEILPNPGSVAPLSVAPVAPSFGYRLSGLITGQHPAAVFTDTAGAQRLVPLNGSLDGDTQLIAVKKGHAVVSFRGKHKELSLGGTPDAN